MVSIKFTLYLWYQKSRIFLLCISFTDSSHQENSEVDDIINTSIEVQSPAFSSSIRVDKINGCIGEQISCNGIVDGGIISENSSVEDASLNHVDLKSDIEEVSEKLKSVFFSFLIFFKCSQ